MLDDLRETPEQKAQHMAMMFQFAMMKIEPLGGNGTIHDLNYERGTGSGPGADDELMGWRYGPQQAEYDITSLTFWSCPCYSKEDVTEKVGLIEQTEDLRFDVERGSALEAMTGQKATKLFLQSLRGETSANINADFSDAIRVS